MKVRAESQAIPGPQADSTSIDELHRQAVLRELESILNSQAFRASKRSQQFLSFVVQRSLEGHTDSLKERIIGAELFHRPTSYATGEDPVVRLKASEVRRRLAQYYHEESHSSPVRIELPVGCYVPEFHWNPAAPPVVLATPRRAENRSKLRLATTIALGLALALVLITIRIHYARPRESTLDQFWSPVFATSQPVLICLAKPVLYRPSLDLYRRFSKAHPGAFQTEVERSNKVLPLDPNEELRWRDMIPFSEFGVAMGDVYVATQLSALFARINKPSQVRIGINYSFEDLRNSPAVLVGAFNNRWTLQMTSDLHFVFAEDNERMWIEERGPSRRVWSMRLGPQGGVAEDYGVVTRLLDSKTGQVLIAAAGIAANGTQAAGEFVCRQDFLTEGLRTAPPDWQKKNLQVVVATTVTDSVAGPPRVVATYFW
ncbi:MAG: hypothetical protein ABSC21_04750 [Terriglobia bacterium]|jgi:hypothetical protein